MTWGHVCALPLAALAVAGRLRRGWGHTTGRPASEAWVKGVQQAHLGSLAEGQATSEPCGFSGGGFPALLELLWEAPMSGPHTRWGLLPFFNLVSAELH